MSIVIITEKPSVAREYKSILKLATNGNTTGYFEGTAKASVLTGKNIIITWAVGHLIRICAPKDQNSLWDGSWSKKQLPMIPETFKHEPIPSTKDQYNIVKQIYTRSDVDTIYYGGDSAREGIFLQSLIRNQIFNHGVKGIEERVIWIDSFTEESILKGIKEAKPLSHYQNMIDSGYARAELDWSIGMNLTRAISITSGSLVNVGRVMTPTLAMLLNRQTEIENFKEKVSFGIKTDFASWKADRKSRYFESPLLNTENAFNLKEDAEDLIADLSKDRRLTVEAVKKEAKKEYAPFLFNLTDIQALCAKVFKINATEALALVQNLYEKGYTTYPRTDSRYLTTTQATEIQALTGMKILDRYVDDSKVSDHFAIVPTYKKDGSDLSGNEKKLFEIICNRTADASKPPMEYDAYSIVYIHSNKEHFYQSARIIRSLGWKEGKVEADEDTESLDHDIISANSIPRENMIVHVKAFTINEIKSKPPKAYTSGSIIVDMEKAGRLITDKELAKEIKTNGIGTPATRAGIIEKLATKRKDGTSFIEINPKNQKITVTDFGKKCIEIVSKYDNALISPVKTAEMELCLHSIADGKLSRESYKNTTEQYIKNIVAKILSSNTEKIVVKTNNSTETGTYNCPCCNNTLKFGKFGYYCDAKNGGCGFSFPNEYFKKKLTEANLKEIITSGKTKLIKKFISNTSGKEFDAYLVLDKTSKKLKFEFPKRK